MKPLQMGKFALAFAAALLAACGGGSSGGKRHRQRREPQLPRARGMERPGGGNGAASDGVQARASTLLLRARSCPRRWRRCASCSRSRGLQLLRRSRPRHCSRRPLFRPAPDPHQARAGRPRRVAVAGFPVSFAPAPAGVGQTCPTEPSVGGMRPGAKRATELHLRLAVRGRDRRHGHGCRRHPRPGGPRSSSRNIRTRRWRDRPGNPVETRFTVVDAASGVVESSSPQGVPGTDSPADLALALEACDDGPPRTVQPGGLSP